ncbi:hypothetical protein V6N11_058320 [Hibiscus sabdariffa]|uniref:Uncharacterized protein n=1 Tax=Hibiscus sabdariffa TaxID=183260 RepID=A0ABR2U479_9ROSI
MVGGFKGLSYAIVLLTHRRYSFEAQERCLLLAGYAGLPRFRHERPPCLAVRLAMPPRACAPCHPMCLMRNFPGAAWCDGAVQPGCCHPPVVAVARLLFPMCTRCLALSRPDTQPCTLGRETDDVLSPPVLAHSRPECYTLSSSVPWQAISALRL